MIVLDASAYCEALLRPADDPLRARLRKTPLAHVPEGFDIEVVNVLRRLCLADAITGAAGRAEVTALIATTAIRRHPITPLLLDMWGLRHNVTGYDAAYVALAASLALPLVTADRRLASSPDLPCAVEAF